MTAARLVGAGLTELFGCPCIRLNQSALKNLGRKT